jgi:hypothetical protein
LKKATGRWESGSRLREVYPKESLKGIRLPECGIYHSEGMVRFSIGDAGQAEHFL